MGEKVGRPAGDGERPRPPSGTSAAWVSVRAGALLDSQEVDAG